MKLFAFAATALLASPAAAQEPEILDLRQYDERLAVEPTQLLSLGTAHLSGWSEFVDRPQLDAALDPLLDRLEAWAPDTIMIENISGANCDHLERYGVFYAGAADTYCRDVGDAGEFTGLSRVEANIAMLETLMKGGPEDTPQARRALAATMLAAGEHYSALVQWLRLPEAERAAGEELSEAMVGRLDKLSTSLNESASIAVPLAVRLGHERVWPVDDHSADQLYLRNAEIFGKRMREIWSSGDTSAREKYMALTEKVKADRDIVSFLREMNSLEAQDMTINNDFAKGLADDQPEGVGQDYANWWQVRNMRMVANIVAAAAMNRSQRSLAIVGASHKAYYDNYLDTMHHIELVDTVDFLAP
ncbi:DUF5694 domain-containing protein [Sphingomicrobium clamense]|uniref:TraB/GumN family protein n=1 Tax=Sphingomicrobium clamense TaxID=2851013 RepID=A0ABS6V2C9_9SPHN|nr:DUF5694 domain-containing protein [Sphingomicrobium sp. B8]MBW0143717.1 hypothetical protein [Sphingomicrobium sp. B8]